MLPVLSHLVMQSINRKPYRFNFPFLMSEKADQLYPVKQGDIPEFIVSIGMLSKIEFEIYSLSNGRKTILEIAQILRISTEKARMVIDSLIKRRIIRISKEQIGRC